MTKKVTIYMIYKYDDKKNIKQDIQGNITDMDENVIWNNFDKKMLNSEEDIIAYTGIYSSELPSDIDYNIGDTFEVKVDKKNYLYFGDKMLYKADNGKKKTFLTDSSFVKNILKKFK